MSFHRAAAARGEGLVSEFPAAHLNGFESSADGRDIIRGLIARGYDDASIVAIAGQNAIGLLRRTIGRPQTPDRNGQDDVLTAIREIARRRRQTPEVPCVRTLKATAHPMKCAARSMNREAH